MTCKYRYRLISTGAGSQKYGPCAGCGKSASEVYHQIEERAYTRDDGTEGWTSQGCYSIFGHQGCLIGRRR